MESAERPAEESFGAARRRRSRSTEVILPEPTAEPCSEDERKIGDLIASRRERLAALEIEYAGYERARTQIDVLMSHNLASLDRAAQELADLEATQQQLRRIRTTLDNG